MRKMSLKRIEWMGNISKAAWKTNISKFDKEFIKNYDESSNKVYILKLDVKYPKYLHDLHSDLAFLPELMKNNKCSKLVCNLYDKKMCCPHKNPKKALNRGLILQKSIK